MRGAGVDSRLLIALVLMAGLLIYHGYYAQRTRVPLSPLSGHARVVDGDSIEIAGARVRLDGIDAPELNQSCADSRGQAWPCGRRAAQQLGRHVAGRELKCTPSGRDRYQRLLATCSLPDGSDVNGWVVREGWAMASGRAGTYRSQQQEAEAARRGIWTGTFVPPRQWRQRHPE